MNSYLNTAFPRTAASHGSRPLVMALATTALMLYPGVNSASAADTTATENSAVETAEGVVVLAPYEVNTVRGSLIGAQEIKQNSYEFVDSIVAQDIGKLPDNSVADALQRVPGIQVGRGNGEVNNVVIRGLPNLGTTLNGNEIFTGTGRGVALQDIPAELVAGVDVYKSTSPDKVEGGIAGLIDIRLRKPLDFDGRRIAGGTRLIYGENADKTGYIGSILLSDRRSTDQGEIGILYSGAYQQRYFVDQTVFNFLFEPVDVPADLVPGETQLQLPFTQGSLIIPGDRVRYAHNVSFQWRLNDEWEFYNDFLSTFYRNENQVHFNIGFPRFGAFTSAEVHPGTNVPITTTSENNFHLTSTQAFKNRTDGYHNVLGAKWSRDAVSVTTEYLYNWNKVQNQVLIVDTRFAPPSPGTFTFTYNDRGRANQVITGADVADSDSYFLWGLFDNHDTSTSEQHGLKVDVAYTPSDGFFREISGGIRGTERDVRFRGTNRNDIAPAGAVGGDRFHPNVPRTSTIPGFGSVNPDGPLDYYDTPHWFGAAPDFLYDNPTLVRALFGLPPGPANFNPTLNFTDEERVIAGYLNGRFETNIGDRRLEGSLGFRVARTTQDLEGYLTSGAPINEKKTQTDVLPILNTRLDLGNNLQLRFGAGRTVTRPDFAALNPATTLNAPTTTGGAAGTGNGGNPDLDTVTSDNFDLALEYYFAESSYVSITGFDREIDGYVQNFAATETIDGIDYIVVRPRNSGKGQLHGAEIAYQHFPEFTGIFEGFGWHINYTYIDGETDADDPTDPSNPPRRTKLPYSQVSEHNYNIIGIYERGRFSARLAYNWRGSFVDTFNGPNSPTSGLRTITVKPTDQLDFSASYAINENFTVTFDATNILDSTYNDYFADATLYPRDTRAYDRTLALGVRFRY